MRFGVIATLFTLLLAFVQVNAKGYYCNQYIVIKHGDRCKDIYTNNKNKSYYVRYKDLMAMNPTLDCDRLSSGSKVCVDADFDKNLPDTYTIKKGDTCKSIAKKLHTTVSVLEHFNLDLLLCKHIKEQVGVEIDYRKDGDYKPVYTKKSKLVPINGN